jgi:hypothetical protein
MFSGALLMPLFLLAAGFWVFGSMWNWVPFNVIFWLITIATIAARPSRVAVNAPMSAQSMSGIFALTLLLAIGIGVALFFYERYWEILLCAAVFIASGLMWPRLCTFGPI